MRNEDRSRQLTQRPGRTGCSQRGLNSFNHEIGRRCHHKAGSIAVHKLCSAYDNRGLGVKHF